MNKQGCQLPAPQPGSGESGRSLPITQPSPFWMLLGQSYDLGDTMDVFPLDCVKYNFLRLKCPKPKLRAGKTTWRLPGATIIHMHNTSIIALPSRPPQRYRTPSAWRRTGKFHLRADERAGCRTSAASATLPRYHLTKAARGAPCAGGRARDAVAPVEEGHRVGALGTVRRLRVRGRLGGRM